MPSQPSGAPPLAELLAAIRERMEGAPEPLAAQEEWLKSRRGPTHGETGTHLDLFTLGMAIVRYAFAVGLAELAQTQERMTLPNPLARDLQTAQRTGDGTWCLMGRRILELVTQRQSELAEHLNWINGAALQRLVASRNVLVHKRGKGEDAPERCLELLESAASLLELPLVYVAPGQSPTIELRMGLPLAPGTWHRYDGPPPPSVRPHGAYLKLDGHWLEVTPWLPWVDGRLTLPDAPTNSGRSWYCYDPSQPCPELDAAIRALLVGAPQALTDRPPFVGRMSEMECIQRAAQEARDGQVRVVLVTGPMGIGRTRVLDEAVGLLCGEGYSSLLQAPCSAERQGLLRPLRLAAADWLPALEAAVEKVLGGDPTARDPGLFEAGLEIVQDALLSAAREAPVALVLHDLQWADDATLRVLRMLTERAIGDGPGHLCVLADVCDGPDQTPGLVKLLAQVEGRGGRRAIRVRLAPLDHSAALDVIHGVAPVDPRLADHILGEAAGIPLFLVRPLLLWWETGTLEWRDDRWCPVSPDVLERPAPRVGELVRARLDSLFEANDKARRAAEVLLALVALAGSRLSTGQALEAAQRAENDTLTTMLAFDMLTSVGMLSVNGEGTQLVFVATMVKTAVLDDALRKSWLRPVRLCLLETLEQSADPVSDGIFLAEGFAALGKKERACHWLRAAVEQLLRVGDYAQVRPLAERFAQLSGKTGDRLEARLWTAEALQRSGQHRDADDVLVAAIALAHGYREATVRLRLLRIEIASDIGPQERGLCKGIVCEARRTGLPKLVVGARLAVANLRRGAGGLRLLSRAESGLGEVPESERTTLAYELYALRAALLYEINPKDDEVWTAARQAREAAEATGSTWARLTCLGNEAVHTESADLGKALARYEEVIAEAGQNQVHSVEREAMNNRVGCLFKLERYAEAVAAAQEAAATFRKSDSWHLEAAVLSTQAHAYLKLRQPALALPAINRSIELKRAHGDVRLAYTLLRRTKVHRALGHIEAALQDAEDAEQAAKENSERASRARWASASLRRKLGPSPRG